MSGDTLMIVAILIGIIQIILILSVVHISAKSDEIVNELKSMNEKLSKIPRPAASAPSGAGANAAPITKANGNTWECKKCGKSNPTSSRICKDCGSER